MHRLVARYTDTTENIKMLISYGIDLNYRIGSDKVSILHLLVKSRSNYLDYNIIKIIKIILDSGADPNILTSFDVSPLYYLTDSYNKNNDDKYVMIAKLLIDYGAIVSGGDLFRIITFNARSELVNILIENGADINYVYGDGDSILHRAAISGNYDLVKYLVDNGAKPIKNKRGEYPSGMSRTDEIFRFLKIYEIMLGLN